MDGGLSWRRGGSGLTLVEFMVAIVVLAILTTISIPSLRAMIQRNRVSAYSSELVGALGLARSEAIKRGMSASVRGPASGSAPLTEGWRIEAPAFASPSTPLIVQTQQGMKNATFCGKPCGGATDAPRSITFNARGNLEKVNGAERNAVNMALIPDDCQSGKEVGRAIRINAVGRIITEPLACP
ncbi:MAG: GspH/FimT family pseudopilin [Zoogloeaceae bacterium]|jgi:type IV fimbrial biogenesis protein FimT|nr:GspH/FimT family pseudopilin [Zoogloeaceae bacterium]